MNVYAKYFDKNSKYMNLLINDKEILENHNRIWNKLKFYLKKDLKVIQCIMINILILK